MTSQASFTSPVRSGTRSTKHHDTTRWKRNQSQLHSFALIVRYNPLSTKAYLEEISKTNRVSTLQMVVDLSKASRQPSIGRYPGLLPAIKFPSKIFKVGVLYRLRPIPQALGKAPSTSSIQISTLYLIVLNSFLAEVRSA